MEIEKIQVQSKKEASLYEKETANISNIIDELTIESIQDLKTSLIWVAEISNAKKEIDEKRKSLADPLKEAVKNLDSFFKKPIQDLTDAKKIIGNSIKNFIETCDNTKNEILQSISETKSTRRKNNMLATLEKYDIPKITGLSIRENKKGAITSKEQIIAWAIENDRLDVIQIDEKVLKKIDKEVPGWSVETEKTVVITPSKIER